MNAVVGHFESSVLARIIHELLQFRDQVVCGPAVGHKWRESSLEMIRLGFSPGSYSVYRAWERNAANAVRLVNNPG